MGSPELTYLIIEEETETISNRRINKIESILNKPNINYISSQAQDFFDNLFSNETI
jgi:hypothetical protein